MPTPTISELKDKISELPQQFIEAMEKRAKADTKVERIEAQIEKLKAQLTSEQKIIEEPPIEEDETSILTLEGELERLKLQLDEAESRAELNFRQVNPRVTESNVQAAVCIDPQVSELKHKHLDAKLAVKMKKSELQKERSVKFEERRIVGLKRRPVIESDELSKLEEKLLDVEEEQTLAYAEVENIKFTLETYKLLGALTSLDID